MRFDPGGLTESDIRTLSEDFVRRSKTSHGKVVTAYKKWQESKKGRQTFLPDVRLLAALSGLSLSSVSNWNRDVPGALSDETREALGRLAERLGYRRSRAAARLRGKETNTIAIALPLTRISTFFLRILEGVKEKAVERGLDLLIFDVNKVEERDRLMEQLPFLGLADGLIVVGLHLEDSELETLQRRNVPVVSVLRDFSHDAVVASVVSENDGGAVEDLVKHFVTVHECTDLALLTMPEENALRMGMVRAESGGESEQTPGVDPFRAQRREGFKRGVRRHGIRHRIFELTDYTEAAGVKAFQDLRKWNASIMPSANSTSPLGVVCMSDPVAAAIMTRASRVARPVLCAGFDDSWLAKACNLTSIPQPAEEMGKHAVEQLNAALRRAKDPTFPVPEKASFKLELKPEAIRESCGCVLRA